MDLDAMEALQAKYFKFINKQKAANTIYKKSRQAERFIDFLKMEGEIKKPEEIQPKMLDLYINTNSVSFISRKSWNELSSYLRLLED